MRHSKACPVFPPFDTTKNEHLHTNITLAWPRVFHGGRFGVSGTPPTKPLSLSLAGVGSFDLQRDAEVGNL